MSRVGTLPIGIGGDVTVTLERHNTVVVTGPKGALRQQVDPDISVEIGADQVRVTRPTDQKRHRALHGLYRSLINNMIIGVSTGYRKELEVVGVGSKAEVKNGVLELALGFSHPIFLLPPEGITVNAGSPGAADRIPRSSSKASTNRW